MPLPLSIFFFRFWRNAMMIVAHSQLRLATRSTGLNLHLKLLLCSAKLRLESYLKRAFRFWTVKALRMDRGLKSMVRGVFIIQIFLRRCLRRQIIKALSIWSRHTYTRTMFELKARLWEEKRRNGLFVQMVQITYGPLRALNRLENISIWSSLLTWKLYIQETEERKVHFEKAGSKALSLLSNIEARIIRAGWVSWITWTGVSHKCERLIKKWRCAVTLAAVQIWRGFIEHLVHKKRVVALLARFLGRLRRAKEAGAWRTWRRARRRGRRRGGRTCPGRA